MWAHVGLRLLWGMLVRIVFVGFGSWWDDFGGERHGCCSRAVEGGLEMCVLDGANTWSLIRPGHESSTRYAQIIRRWGLLRESAPGAVHW